MSGDSYIRAAAAAGANPTKPPITTGWVVDNDDPQQNSRVRVCCPAWGDDPNPQTMVLKNIPWATMGSPMAGSMTQGYRGTSTKVDGQTPYGFVGVPKVGAEVVVVQVDGDSGYRVVLCCLPELGGTGAAPHGRFETSGGYPDGPFTLDGSKLQPLYDNYSTMFSGPYFPTGRSSFEWMSRGSDYSFSAHVDTARNERQSTNDPIDVFVAEADGRVLNYTAGYAKDRVGDQPNLVKDDDRTNDPQTYAWISPGFHSYSMDDRPENCRMRIRTTTGHQILLDDTNERIYIATSKGKNWVEMDSCGNVDVHSDTRVSIHAANDINMTSEGSIRLTSGDIHLRASGQIRMISQMDTHIITNMNLRTKSLLSTKMEIGQMLETISAMDTKITSGTNVHVLATSGAYVTGSGSVHVLSSGNIMQTAATIYSNSGAAAQSADSATLSEAKTAFHTNRIPMHEPWPRVLTDVAKSDKDDAFEAVSVVYQAGTMLDMEFKTYNDFNIGRLERGASLGRNAKWHR